MAEFHMDSIDGDGKLWISGSSRKIIAIVRKLAEQNPEQCVIKKQPEENDGWIYAHVPIEFLKIARPRRLNLSDEQRQAIGQRLKSGKKDFSDMGNEIVNENQNAD